MFYSQERCSSSHQSDIDTESSNCLSYYFDFAVTLFIERNGFIDWLRGSQNVANSNCYSLLRSHSSGCLVRFLSFQRTAAPEITIVSEFRPSEKPLIVHLIIARWK